MSKTTYGHYSEGGPGEGAPGAGGQNREVCSRACTRHGIAFNQSRTRTAAGKQWSEWCPPECPQCSEETRQRLEYAERTRKFHEEILPAMSAEIAKESEERFAAQADSGEQIEAHANTLLEEACKEFCALNRAGYLALAKSQLLAGIDREIIAERFAKYLEEQEGAKARAAAEEQEKLDAGRKRKAEAALASWVPMA